MKGVDKATVQALDGFVDWHEIFPRSKTRTGHPDLRKPLSRRAKTKIKNLAAEFAQAGGVDKFHKVRKSAKRDQTQFITGTKHKFRGYFSGFEIETHGKGRAMVSRFKDGMTGRVSEYNLYSFSSEPETAEQLKRMIRETYQQIHGNPQRMGIMNGSDKYQVTDIDNLQMLINETVIDFEKYKSMAELEETRENGRYAADPADWMRGLVTPR